MPETLSRTQHIDFVNEVMLQSFWFICTLTNSEYPDEMPHNAAFHQGLHRLLW